jgi:uncharacterized membrane protein YjjP (DUF1212 family)
MGRLAKVHKIARALVNGDLEPPEALVTLKAVNGDKPLYNAWIAFASVVGYSGFICPLIFKGSWYDVLVSMGLGSRSRSDDSASQSILCLFARV